jgi:hypothetical protein
MPRVHEDVQTDPKHLLLGALARRFLGFHFASFLQVNTHFPANKRSKPDPLCKQNLASNRLIQGRLTNNDAEGSGAAYVFENRGIAGWVQSAYVKASNAGVSQSFGTALTLSADGNALVVGANTEKGSSSGISDGKTTDELTDAAGAAYMFHRSAGLWTQLAYIKSLEPGRYDIFGSDVAISGDGQTLAIGSEFDDGSSDSVYNTGVVHIVR